MTRRAFFATLTGVMATGSALPARTGVHVQGRLMVDTADLSDGYFVMCGLGTGQCNAKDAIAISVHPQNTRHTPLLAAMVGRDVQFSLYEL